MSQDTKIVNPGSEDLFTTQDMLMETPVIGVTSNITDDVEIIRDLTENVEVNPDDGLEDDGDEFMAELETESELLNGAADEDLENDEPTEKDEELMQEEEAEPIETKLGVKTKPPPKTNRISELPLSKIKHIIKLDPEVNLVNSEAVFLITKATESFIKTLAKESFTHAAQQKKKTITKSHVDQALTMLPIEL